MNDKEVPAVFRALTAAGEISFKTDPTVLYKPLNEADFEGMPVLYLNDDAETGQVVFYIHGGYYVYQMGGEAWAGSLPMDNWQVSPIYGDLLDLKNVTIFVGTREWSAPSTWTTAVSTITLSVPLTSIRHPAFLRLMTTFNRR